MPTVVSYLRSNAYRPKDNGTPGEGEVFNTQTNVWEEPDADEKELLLGYTLRDTAAAGVSDEDRAVRLGRALDGTTMRWLGEMLHASRHRNLTPPSICLLSHLGGGECIQRTQP